MTVRKFKKLGRKDKLNFMIWLITMMNSVDVNSKTGWLITEYKDGKVFEIMSGDGKYRYKTAGKNTCKQLFAAKCYRHAINMTWFKATICGV